MRKPIYALDHNDVKPQLAAWAKAIRAQGRLGRGFRRRIPCAVDLLPLGADRAYIAYYAFWQSHISEDNDRFKGTPEKRCEHIAKLIDTVYKGDE